MTFHGPKEPKIHYASSRTTSSQTGDNLLWKLVNTAGITATLGGTPKGTNGVRIVTGPAILGARLRFFCKNHDHVRSPAFLSPITARHVGVEIPEPTMSVSLYGNLSNLIRSSPD